MHEAVLSVLSSSATITWSGETICLCVERGYGATDKRGLVAWPERCRDGMGGYRAGEKKAFLESPEIAAEERRVCPDARGNDAESTPGNRMHIPMMPRPVFPVRRLLP